MLEAVENLIGLNTTQTGLVLDIIGFILIFVFGGFQFGVHAYSADDYDWYVLPSKVIGSFMVVVGFILQIVGSGQ